MSVSNEFQSRFLELSEEFAGNNTTLAQAIGIKYETFSKIKNYGILPTPKILIRIADHFNVSLEFLLAKSDDEYFNKTDKPKTLFERLEELKNSKNLTYYQLGKKVHINSNYFSGWKKNNYIPSLEYLTLLADYFEVSLDYLLGRTDENIYD